MQINSRTLEEMTDELARAYSDAAACRQAIENLQHDINTLKGYIWNAKADARAELDSEITKIRKRGIALPRFDEITDPVPGLMAYDSVNDAVLVYMRDDGWVALNK